MSCQCKPKTVAVRVTMTDKDKSPREYRPATGFVVNPGMGLEIYNGTQSIVLVGPGHWSSAERIQKPDCHCEPAEEKFDGPITVEFREFGALIEEQLNHTKKMLDKFLAEFGKQRK